MNKVEARDVNAVFTMKLGFNLVSDMTIKVGFTSVIRRKSPSLFLFLPRLRTLK